MPAFENAHRYLRLGRRGIKEQWHPRQRRDNVVGGGDTIPQMWVAPRSGLPFGGVAGLISLTIENKGTEKQKNGTHTRTHTEKC